MAAMEKQRGGGQPVEVATYASGAPAFMSLLRGVLVVHQGCLVVGDDQGRSVLVVFRAQDIDWDGEVLTYEGRRYRLGDSIDLGGGLMALQRLTVLRLPEGRADAVEAFVVAPSGP
jgi:hypothetical protein